MQRWFSNGGMRIPLGTQRCSKGYTSFVSNTCSIWNKTRVPFGANSYVGHSNPVAYCDI